MVACSHVSKLVRCEQDERGGVQDVLLLRDEVANVGDERRLHVDEPLLVRIEELTSRADLLPDKVIQGPHRRGGPVEALLLEHGIELVLFSGQVFLILFQPIVYAEPLVLDGRILDKILDGQADLLQLVVLCVVARDGVVVRKLWARAIDEAIEEGEHALDVLLALPLLELLELLLRQGDLVRLDGVHPLAQAPSAFLEGDRAAIVGILYLEDELELIHVMLGNVIHHALGLALHLQLLLLRQTCPSGHVATSTIVEAYCNRDAAPPSEGAVNPY